MRKISGEYGYIDLFWPGMLLVEHKSRGQDLGKAESQAFRYIRDLVREGRQDEIPRYVIVSDFARIALHDLEPEEQKRLPLFDQFRVESIEFPLDELHKNIHHLAFIPGYKQHKFEDQDPINLRAVRIMDDLHDTLAAGGYSGHDLERFLVRVLFCLFAEDTGIFERERFRLVHRGPDEAGRKRSWAAIGAAFRSAQHASGEAPEESRRDAGGISLTSTASFSRSSSGFADFNRDMRNSVAGMHAVRLVEHFAGHFRLAVSGSHGQPEPPPDRRPLHKRARHPEGHSRPIPRRSASRVSIASKTTKTNSSSFTRRLAGLRFLDPACGCGNFLVIAYRELRLLEIEVLVALHGTKQQHLDIQSLSLVDVDAFYGIEISEWPARIAEVAMWLMDHQMNVRLSEVFGQYFVRLPLEEIAHDRSRQRPAAGLERRSFRRRNAVTCSAIRRSLGKQFMTKEQRSDMALVCGEHQGLRRARLCDRLGT